MAISTTLRPASSPSQVVGGTPTTIVQECTTIPVLPQVPPAADATTLPISTPSDVVTVPISLPIIIVSEDPYKSSATSTPRRTRFFHRAPTLATSVLLRRAPASASTTSFFNNAPASASPRRLRHALVLEYHRGRRARVSPFPWRSQPLRLLTRGFSNTSSDSPDNPHRRSTYTSGVFRTTPSAFRTIRADFHRWKYSAIGG